MDGLFKQEGYDVVGSAMEDQCRLVVENKM